jgi:preprotein translocase subunit SecA
MSRAALLADGVLLARGRPYTERQEAAPGWHDRAAEYLSARLVQPLNRVAGGSVHALRRILADVDRHDRALRVASDDDLRNRAAGLRTRLRRQGFTRVLSGESFALIREVAGRTIGQRHYETQLQAGWALLQGRFVEMATGEGKTIAATLPAATVALGGFPVHVVTVNDYLAARDAAQMAPLYGFLGLSVGTVIQGMQRAERRQQYARAITYCTNKELAFDYLRDGIAAARSGSALQQALRRLSGAGSATDAPVLRGLCYGLVDEADSIFIDEARTPLILSSPSGGAEEATLCRQALDTAQALDPDQHFSLRIAERSVVLSAVGQARIAELTHDLGGIWTSPRARDEQITQAICALLLFRKDEHYVVAENRVQIVDESTGRIMPDRSWERGLHQLVEAKEGCELTPRNEILARLTYQRLFRRYVRLAGMTGTAAEVAHEVRAVYGLRPVRIPLHRALRRSSLTARVLPSRTAKWQAVADAVRRVALAEDRPVLIGTRSVTASEELSAVLHAHGIEHALLNAKQNDAEAEVIALAGQPGRVTVATNMAGRGTDIALGPGVAERGGLHVILTEFHDSRRVDRQLFGRCARQGDPGSCQVIVSLEDEIFTLHAAVVLPLCKQAARKGMLPHAAVGLLRAFAQSAAQRRGAEQRIEALRTDRNLQQLLAFAGRGE